MPFFMVFSSAFLIPVSLAVFCARQLSDASKFTTRPQAVYEGPAHPVCENPPHSSANLFHGDNAIAQFENSRQRRRKWTLREQNGPVLHERAALPALGASYNLRGADEEISWRQVLEAQQAGKRRLDPRRLRFR